jgi:hypothetical protein
MQICENCYSPVESGESCENCSASTNDDPQAKSRFRITPVILVSSAAVVALISSGLVVLSMDDPGQPANQASQQEPPPQPADNSQIESEPETVENHSHNHGEALELKPGGEFTVIFEDETPETMPRWDPCTFPTYAINKGSSEPAENIVRDGFELDDADLLRQAFERTEELSGLRFLYLSKTSDTYEKSEDYSTNLGKADVLVQYLREDEYRVAAEESGLSTSIAFAGPLARRVIGETGYLVAGRIIINADEIQRLLDEGREEIIAAAYLHEIGHLIGLGHVENPDALMFGGPSYFDTFTEGDKLGFEWAGAGPCE